MHLLVPDALWSLQATVRIRSNDEKESESNFSICGLGNRLPIPTATILQQLFAPLMSFPIFLLLDYGTGETLQGFEEMTGRSSHFTIARAVQFKFTVRTWPTSNTKNTQRFVHNGSDRAVNAR